MRREPVLMLLLVLSALTVVLAVALGRDVAAALAGALLVVAYWLLESLAARLSEQGSIQRAMVIGAIGTVTRLTVVVAGLVIVALVDRPGVADAIVAFVAVYTVYLGVRLWRYAAGAQSPAGLAPGHRHRSAR